MTIVKGKLYKKGKSTSDKKWLVRDFEFDKSTKVLTYSWRGDIKGAVLVSDTVYARAIESNVEDERDFIFEIFCYKIQSNGDIEPGLRSFIVAAYSSDELEFWLKQFNPAAVTTPSSNKKRTGTTDTSSKAFTNQNIANQDYYKNDISRIDMKRLNNHTTEILSNMKDISQKKETRVSLSRSQSVGTQMNITALTNTTSTSSSSSSSTAILEYAPERDNNHSHNARPSGMIRTYSDTTMDQHLKNTALSSLSHDASVDIYQTPRDKNLQHIQTYSNKNSSLIKAKTMSRKGPGGYLSSRGASSDVDDDSIVERSRHDSRSNSDVSDYTIAGKSVNYSLDEEDYSTTGEGGGGGEKKVNMTVAPVSSIPPLKTSSNTTTNSNTIDATSTIPHHVNTHQGSSSIYETNSSNVTPLSPLPDSNNTADSRPIESPISAVQAMKNKIESKLNSSFDDRPLSGSREQRIQSGSPRDITSSREQKVQSGSPRDITSSREQKVQSGSPRDIFNSREQKVQSMSPRDIFNSREQKVQSISPRDRDIPTLASVTANNTINVLSSTLSQSREVLIQQINAANTRIQYLEQLYAQNIDSINNNDNTNSYSVKTPVTTPTSSQNETGIVSNDVTNTPSNHTNMTPISTSSTPGFSTPKTVHSTVTNTVEMSDNRFLLERDIKQAHERIQYLESIAMLNNLDISDIHDTIDTPEIQSSKTYVLNRPSSSSNVLSNNLTTPVSTSSSHQQQSDKLSPRTGMSGSTSYATPMMTSPSAKQYFGSPSSALSYSSSKDPADCTSPYTPSADSSTLLSPSKFSDFIINSPSSYQKKQRDMSSDNSTNNDEMRQKMELTQQINQAKMRILYLENTVKKNNVTI